MTTSVADTYARAVVALAAERGALETLREAAASFAAAFDGTPELRRGILTPAIDRHRKGRAIAAALGTLVPDFFGNFLALVIEKGRAGLLRRMLDRIGALAVEAQGKVRAELVAAAPPSDAQRQAVIDALTRRLGADVVLTERVDPSLLGGFVLRYRDRVADGSIRGRLADLRAHLSARIVGDECIDENQG